MDQGRIGTLETPLAGRFCFSFSQRASTKSGSRSPQGSIKKCSRHISAETFLTSPGGSPSFRIMSDTAKIKLQELASISAGHPIRGAVDRLSPGDVALLQIRDVDPDVGIDWTKVLRVDPPGKRKPNYLLPGDIVFTSRGVRNLAVALNDVPAPAICAPNLFVVRLDPSCECLPEYIAWFMNQRPAQDYFLRSATGTNILNIRREVIEQLVVIVPSLNKQRAIVEFAAGARIEREKLSGLIRNRDQQMEAIALSLASRSEV